MRPVPEARGPDPQAASPRTAPGRAPAPSCLLRWAAAEGAEPMDPDLPDRVLRALGLTAQARAPSPSLRRRAARALALLVAAGMLLLLLPARPRADARWAAAPGAGARHLAPPAAPAASERPR